MCIISPVACCNESLSHILELFWETSGINIIWNITSISFRRCWVLSMGRFCFLLSIAWRWKSAIIKYCLEHNTCACSLYNQDNLVCVEMEWKDSVKTWSNDLVGLFPCCPSFLSSIPRQHTFLKPINHIFDCFWQNLYRLIKWQVNSQSSMNNRWLTSFMPSPVYIL